MMRRTSVIGWLLGLLRPFWRGILLSTLLGFFTILSSVALMAASAWLISKCGLRPSVADLGVSIVSVRFFGITRGVMRYLERLVSHSTTFKLLAELRVAFYAAVEPLAPAGLTQYRSGDLLGRVLADIETLQDIYLRVIAPPLVALMVALATALLFASFDPLVALVLLMGMGISATAIPLIAYCTARGAGQARIAGRAALNANFLDTVQGLADATAYGYSARQLDALHHESRHVAALEARVSRWDTLQNALGVAAVNLTALAVLATAIPRIDGLLLATVTLATVAAFEAVTPLAQAAVHLGANLSAAQRLHDILQTPPAVSPPQTPLPAPRGGALTLDGVVFRYAPHEPSVLDGLTLDIASGQCVAILGASGSGKSSLVNVLLRFWEYQGGVVMVGGRDLRGLAFEDVRAHFSVMTQRTHLFNTTLRENIRIARPDASDADVEAAAQRAQIHDFIMTLPDGYDTMAGENGAKLSGGERQRVALARALLKDSPVLILDEATAHLDAMTEQAILETLLESTQGRTLILLTHRRTLLERMNCVYRLEGGRLQAVNR